MSTARSSLDSRVRAVRGSRWLPLVIAAMAIVGALLGAFEARLIVDRPDLPRDLVAYLRAGDALRAGQPIYTIDLPLNGAFLYSPVWAVIYGAISWLPGQFLWAVSIVLNLCCLRYVVGSWRAVGVTFLWPFTAFAVMSGNLDMLIAAALVGAWRGHVGALALVATAKIAPAIGLPWHRWRAFAATSMVLLLLTLPWWHLWPEWLQFLVRQPTSGEFLIAVPWWSRLPVALALLALRRPWATALAAVVATPAVYLHSSLLLLAPLRLWLDARSGRLEPVIERSPWRPWRGRGATVRTDPTAVAGLSEAPTG